MAFEFELPDVGEGVAEGEIVAWHVEPGEAVEEDQVLADVETDKAVVDLPSPVNGVIETLHAEEGEMVKVGSVVVTIETDGDADAETDTAADADAETSGEPAAETSGETANGTSATAATGDGRVFAPPNVRKLARELGVDITTVEGSGPSGRITEADVRTAASDDEAESGATASDDESDTKKAAVKRTGDGESATESTTASTSISASDGADRDQTLAVPATRRVAREEGVDLDAVPTEKTRDGEAFVEIEDIKAYAEAQQQAQEADAQTPVTVEDSERVSREPYRGIRRTIGDQMAESAYTAPHVTHHDTATVPELVEAREELKARAEKEDVKLTYMPFVMKAIVAGLKEFPVLNTELDEEEDEVIYKHYYNLGIAVATDAGLMVPVVENVDEKGMLELAAEVNDLSSRARSRDLSPQEMRGGTFTITNFGAIGGEYATPIINYPETGILGLGGIEQRPVAEDGEVTAAHTLPLSLSVDHRVIDGAEAAQFCNTVMEYLENPTLLLLE